MNRNKTQPTTGWIHKGIPAILFLSALILVLLLGVPSASAQKGAPPYVSGQLIVRYKTNVADRTKDEIETRHGDQKVRDFRNIESRIIKLSSKRTVEQAVQEYRSESNVAYAEPNYVVHTLGGPNDPQYPQLWGMKNTGQNVGGIIGKSGADIKAEQAWAITTGTSSVVVGVVDTGVDYTHPDLAANIWSNPGGVGSCAAGTHGYNAITGTCDPRDDNNHGTHVSGTIGAVGNNGVGVVGVNWRTQIMGLKFLDSTGSGSTSDAITAIDFAINAKAAGVNVRVLSNSWGGGGFSQALLDEINKAGANGILFVVAAGNSTANADTSPSYPCSYTSANIICVAATDQNDNLASFSNYGSTSVDLGAPGVNILSTIAGGGYDYYSGTSMATPHVAGAAALILSAPGQAGLTVDQLKSAILNNVDPIPSLAGKTVTGGRLNVCKAIPGCNGAPAPTSTPTATSTTAPTRTNTPTPTRTNTPAATPTRTNTPAATPTRTNTLAATPTRTNTPAATPTRTNTPTRTATSSPGATATSTATRTPSSGNVVINSGFESGAGIAWTENSSGGYELIDTTKPHTGRYSADECGYNACAEYVQQQITIPSNATLTYWLFMTSNEGTTTPYDYMYVRLYSTGGALLATLRTWSNTSTRNSWSQDSISLAAFSGQTVKLQFITKTNNTLPSRFWVDDVSVQ